jgi:hypothetical protein
VRIASKAASARAVVDDLPVEAMRVEPGRSGSRRYSPRELGLIFAPTSTMRRKPSPNSRTPRRLDAGTTIERESAPRTLRRPRHNTCCFAECEVGDLFRSPPAARVCLGRAVEREQWRSRMSTPMQTAAERWRLTLSLQSTLLRRARVRSRRDVREPTWIEGNTARRAEIVFEGRQTTKAEASAIARVSASN